MKTFKEIFLICLSIILMFGGLGLVLTAELANGIMLLGGVMVMAGIYILIYWVKGYFNERY